MTGSNMSAAPGQPTADNDIDEYDNDETLRMPTVQENDLANPDDGPLPLPSRPSVVTRKPSLVASTIPSHGKRPRLQSNPTTALSSIEIETVSFPDGSRETYSTPHIRPARDSGTLSRRTSLAGSELDDVASLMSYGAPTLRASDDLQSLMEDSLNTESIAWKMLSAQSDAVNPFENLDLDEYDQLAAFDTEFDEIPGATDGNEGVYCGMRMKILADK